MANNYSTSNLVRVFESDPEAAITQRRSEMPWITRADKVEAEIAAWESQKISLPQMSGEASTELKRRLKSRFN